MRRGADRSRVVSACDSSDVFRLLSPCSRHHTDSQVGALLLGSFLEECIARRQALHCTLRADWRVGALLAVDRTALNLLFEHVSSPT